MKKKILVVIFMTGMLMVLTWFGNWSSVYHSWMAYHAIYDIRYLFALMVGLGMLMLLRLQLSLSMIVLAVLFSGLLCRPWFVHWTYPAGLFLGFGIYRRLPLSFNSKAVWAVVLGILLINGICEYYASVIPTYWLYNPQGTPPTMLQLFLVRYGLKMVSMLFCGYAVGLFQKHFSSSILPSLILFAATLILGEGLRYIIMGEPFFIAFCWQGSIALALALMVNNMIHYLQKRRLGV